MNITNLLESGANVTVAVSLTDLREFALDVRNQAMKDAEEQSNNNDEEVDADEAARILGVSRNTLWRWAKEKYLEPYRYLGKRPLYLMSQLKQGRA